MHFAEVERVEYKHNILFEVLFQARFPEILKISKDVPVEFQDIIRKEGYPEFVSDIPILLGDKTTEFNDGIPPTKVFRFFTIEKDWEVSLSQNFIALTCKGNYSNYDGFRSRLETVMQTFSEIYEPTYFTRIGLRHKNIANKTSLPHAKERIQNFIPEHIFPELETSIAENIDSLQKVTQFNDGEMKVNVAHVLSKVSGKLRQLQFTDEKSYVIDIDCFSDSSQIKEINDVLTRCDIFKRHNWNIFQWSITDSLRRAME